MGTAARAARTRPGGLSQRSRSVGVTPLGPAWHSTRAGPRRGVLVLCGGAEGGVHATLRRRMHSRGRNGRDTLDLPFVDLGSLPVLAGTEVAGDLVILVAAAVLGGYLAGLARQPLVVGYIAGGVVIGPTGAGLVDDIEDVQFIGELGIALLLFTIGLEFPLRQFRALRDS